MLQPIQLLKKELARLRDIANVKEHNGIKAEENEVIPAYENSIQFLEEVNDVDASQHKALHKHIVKPRFPKEQLHLKRGSRILNIRGRHIVNRPEILINCMEYWEPDDEDFGSAEENDATYYPTIEEIDKIIEALTEAKAFLNGA